MIGFGIATRHNRKPKNPKSPSKKESKKISAAKKELETVKEQTQPLPAPPAIPLVPSVGTTQTQGDIQSLQEFPIGQKLDIEITRLAEGTLKRITIAKGKVPIRSRGGRPIKMAKLLFFVWQRGAQYYVNPKKIIKVTTTIKGVAKVSYKLVYDALYAEPLNQDGTIDWDDELELILADSGEDQYVTIAAFEGGFQFTPTLVRAIIIIALLGGFLGLALNGTNHFIPTTEIHWVP